MREKKPALGMAVLNYHSSVQKEQQRKQDKFQRERLNALKNDDEEAYMKLIDEAKDTRISHLLKQIDQYFESLAKAVASQQNQNFFDNNSTVNSYNGTSTSSSSSSSSSSFITDEDNIIETMVCFYIYIYINVILIYCNYFMLLISRSFLSSLNIWQSGRKEN